MYLHLGQSVVVHLEDVVGIFDLDNTTASHRTRAFLNRAQREGSIINISEELPRSFVLCRREGKSLVYLSQLSPATLARRAAEGFPRSNAEVYAARENNPLSPAGGDDGPFQSRIPL